MYIDLRLNGFNRTQDESLTQDPNDINRRFGQSFKDIFETYIENSDFEAKTPGGVPEKNEYHVNNIVGKLTHPLLDEQLTDADKEYFLRPISYEITITNSTGGLLSRTSGDIANPNSLTLDPIYPNPGYILQDDTATPLSYPLSNGNTINIWVNFQRSYAQ